MRKSVSRGREAPQQLNYFANVAWLAAATTGVDATGSAFAGRVTGKESLVNTRNSLPCSKMALRPVTKALNTPTATAVPTVAPVLPWPS